MARLPVQPLLRLAPAALVLLAGCASPFSTSEDDLGRVIPIERLRTVGELTLTPAPPRASADDSLPGPAEPVDRFTGKPSVELDLAEARASALVNNLDLRVSLVDPSIAAQRLAQEEAAFDAVFFVDGRWSNTDTPTASQLVANQQEVGTLTPGFRLPLRTGGTAQAQLPIARIETNNQFATLNPAYTSDLEFTLSQPLLERAGRRIATAGIRIASYERQITDARTTLAVIAQLAAVDRAYWRLFAAWESLGVAQQQFELAVTQLERAQRQRDAGRVAEIEVIRAEAGVADRVESVIVAENRVLRTQRELKRRVNAPGLGVRTDTIVLPATDPNPVRYDIDRDRMLAAAIANRMELLEIELRLLADAVNIELAENQTLPTLDIDLTYRFNGLGESLSESFEQTAENDFEDWAVGLRFETPIDNAQARASLRQAVLTRLQRIGTREAREQTIRQEVLDSIDEIETAWQRILATRQAVVVNRRALDAEQRQFELGRSTTLDVLDAQANLAQAEFAEIQAVVDYQIAQIALAESTGLLLGASAVSWEPLGLEELTEVSAEAPPASADAG